MSVSNFLWNKWCRSFRIIDLNKDGYATEEDFVGIAEFISKKTNASPEQAELTRATWAAWLPRLTDVDKLDVYSHNNGLAKLWLKDRKAFREEMVRLFSDLFDNLDLNKDGYVSLDELEVIYEAFGVTDQRFVKGIFDTIDSNGNGLIERSEYVEAMVQYNSKPEEPDKFQFVWDPSLGQDKPTGFR